MNLFRRNFAILKNKLFSLSLSLSSPLSRACSLSRSLFASSVSVQQIYLLGVAVVVYVMNSNAIVDDCCCAWTVDDAEMLEMMSAQLRSILAAELCPRMCDVCLCSCECIYMLLYHDGIKFICYAFFFSSPFDRFKFNWNSLLCCCGDGGGCTNEFIYLIYLFFSLFSFRIFIFFAANLLCRGRCVFNFSLANMCLLKL